MTLLMVHLNTGTDIWHWTICSPWRRS